MKLKIAISSGKGGTGKTFISTNIAGILQESGQSVRYLDCDVEEPNGHLFLKPTIDKKEEVTLLSPVDIDADRCTGCGLCAKACHYNAIAMVKKKALFFKNLCHICGACSIVCPENAIIEKQRKIGFIKHGHSGPIDFHYAELETAEGGMSPRLIKRVKNHIGAGINILDSPPGTACPVVETIKNTDLCILVTDPTPFGIHDLKLAVDMCRELNQEPVVLVNRAEYSNDDLKTYCREACLDIIGEIPDDRKIAECYSEGDLAVEKLPQYHDLFQALAKNILERARNKQPVRKTQKNLGTEEERSQQVVQHSTLPQPSGEKSRELVVISGKGGTGKTSLVAGFCALDSDMVIADCDVDAADLHLILNPDIKQKGYFSGSDTAEIDADKCTGCGDCFDSCRFEAIRKTSHNGRTVFRIDKMSCEGCGVCCIVCPEKAVTCEPAINGEWYLSKTRFGPMSHAKLGIAEENSGKLVTLVRNNKEILAQETNRKKAIIDGSPGTGCPVIASLTGADYALVVTEPTVSGVHDLKRILDVIKFFSVRSGVVVNKYDLNLQKTKDIEMIAKEYDSEFLGTLPYDKRMTQAQVKGLSVVEYTDAEISRLIKSIFESIKKSVFK
ncbi:P-loop NTPase [candidate division KSB1 bacterium]|nr:P-loop NTPase [candidate division KSB1 bacterium]